jgi:hypothetical protein
MTMPDRRSPRYQFDLACSIRPLDDGAGECSGVIANVARQGCCLTTSDGELAVPGRVEITCAPQADEPPITLVGTTTWKRESEGRIAYGVEFLPGDPASTWAMVAAAYDRWRSGLPAADDSAGSSRWWRGWRSLRAAIGLGGH